MSFGKSLFCVVDLTMRLCMLSPYEDMVGTGYVAVLSETEKDHGFTFHRVVFLFVSLWFSSIPNIEQRPKTG